VGDFRAQRGYSGSVFFHLNLNLGRKLFFFLPVAKVACPAETGTLCTKCNVESKTAGYKLPAEPPRLGGKISG